MFCHLRAHPILVVIVLLGFVATVHAGQPNGDLRSTTSDVDSVLPIVVPKAKVDLQGVDQRIYVATERLAHYLLELAHPWADAPQYVLLTESKSNEHTIRPNTGSLEGFCFLYRFGPYEESVVGVSRRDLLQKTILPMMRYLVATHVTGPRTTDDGKKWGDHWQSAYWTQMLACGAWWTWDDLPADLRSDVRRVVAHEADRIAHTEPPHQVLLDTKAEENAWNSRILELAGVLMPNDPRRSEWEAAFRKWVLSSFLRPADEHSQRVVDGRTVAAQFTGANIHDDFTLENHDIVHPDYMADVTLSLAAAVDYTISGRRSPECLLYNASEIFENLKWLALPNGGVVYPNGQDWELLQCSEPLQLDLLMAIYAHDPDGWSMACRLLGTVEKMQARSSSGDVYGPGESFFPSIHTDLIKWLSMSWLTLQTAEQIDRASQDRIGVRRFDDGKIILRRTGTAIHSFSWGNVFMAQCIPYRHDQLVSPDQQNGIGHIRIKNAQEPAIVKVEAVDVTNGNDWFTAKATVVHGNDQIRSELCYRSNADGSWTMQERLIALADVTTTEIATGLISILNNPTGVYEHGSRKLLLDGREEHNLPALSGLRFSRSECNDIAVDSVLQIHSARPLSIRYVGAGEPRRARATDEIYLNYLGGERTWHRGDTISEYEVNVRCMSP